MLNCTIISNVTKLSRAVQIDEADMVSGNTNCGRLYPHQQSDWLELIFILDPNHIDDIILFDDLLSARLDCANESVIAGTAELAKPNSEPNIDNII